jgi:hypothetical protein
MNHLLVCGQSTLSTLVATYFELGGKRIIGRILDLSNLKLDEFGLFKIYNGKVLNLSNLNWQNFELVKFKNGQIFELVKFFNWSNFRLANLELIKF